MSSKLMDFFSAAQQSSDKKLKEEEAAVLAGRQAADAEQRRKTVQAANLTALDERLQDEFGNLFKTLEQLPEKDKKRFEVSATEHLGSSSTDAVRNISVYYKLQQPPRKNMSFDAFSRSMSDYVDPKPGFSLSVRRKQDGVLEINVTQFTQLESDPYGSGNHYLTTKTADFTSASKLIGEELGRFAPERLDDIGKALGLLTADGNPAVPRPAAASPLRL